MKGIILLGGSGTRLAPITNGVSKQLLNIYDKPMAYYSMSILMLAGIKEIFIISDPNNLPIYQRVFGDGSSLGMRFSYCVQERPAGIAQAFLLASYFIENDECCLMLGDNLFHASGLSKFLRNLRTKVEKDKGAAICAYRVSDPQRYGVVEFDSQGKAVSLEEKPVNPKSNFAVPGLYFYDKNVVQYARELRPSSRGELEVTDLNRRYMQNKQLHVEVMPRGFAWLDTGTIDSLMESSSFVQAIEKRQGIKLGCIEEIAYRNGWISKEQVSALGQKMSTSEYGKYLISVAQEG